MNKSSKTSRSRRTARAAALAGLVFLPACSLPTALHREPDHVFSARSPQQIEHESGSVALPVRARYPQSVDSAAPDLTSADPQQTQPIAASWSADGQGNPFQFAIYRPENDEQPEGVVRTSYLVSEPRMPFDPKQPPSNQMQTVAAGPMADLFPDEYVFDGGDRNAPVHYYGGDRMGLETEDTVAEFSDHTGAYRIRPSNRVAVYSPRFGSVRSVNGLETDVKIDSALGARDTIGAGNLNAGVRGESNTRIAGIIELDSRHRADGMESALPPSLSSGTEHALLSRKIDKGQEDRLYTDALQLGRLDSPIVSEQLRNAVIWTRNLFPQITVSTDSAGEVSTHFKAQQTVGVEDERQTKGDLRIVKLADRGTAQSGDTIQFTIQVQNVGDFDVYDVRVTDNLTPRLQYVPGSASIDEKNPGEVTAVPNGEGSQILTFTLDNPLRGHASAVITFEARVR